MVFENDDESYTCLQSCPVGFYERTDPDSTKQGRIAQGHPKGMGFPFSFLNFLLFSLVFSIVFDHSKGNSKKVR